MQESTYSIKRRRRQVLGRTSRSKITNGEEDFFDHLDGRSKRARRYRDIKNDLMYELHYPSDLLTKWSVKQLSAMLVLLEEAQRAIVAGDPVNMGELVKLSGAVRRHVQSLGLSRVQMLNGNGKPKRIVDDFEIAIGGYHTPPDTK